MKHPRCTSIALLTLLAAGCQTRGTATTPAATTPSTDVVVLARVNGVAITREDLRAEVRGKGGDGRYDADKEPRYLETVIRNELAAQRAAELGLDPGEVYQRELRRREAEVAAWKRRALADELYRHEANKVQVTDAEARRYFDENQVKLRTTVHVLQILSRDEAAITRAQADLARGEPFEKVARAQLPDVPLETKPWDLTLHFKQIPQPWLPVLEKLKPGETSDIIRGPKGRLWIIRLLERGESKPLDFDEAKPMIIEDLKASRAEQLREELATSLRARARLE